MNWYKSENGNTIGTSGSEGGKILIDDENELGARITLENCKQHFAITCGIYGWFFHTRFTDESDAFKDFDSMKAELELILNLIPEDNKFNKDKMAEISEKISSFVDKFP